MLNVKITIDDGKGKKAEVNLSETDNLSKLVIIQNVFNLFDIKNDVLEMVQEYNRIGKAYSSFFNKIETDEIQSSNEETEIKNDEIRQQMIHGLTLDKEELESTYKSTEDQPDFVTTGIKIRPDGTKLYRLHYKCNACWNTGTHYVFENSATTWCHKCQHKLFVYPATSEPFPARDTFGNFFRAGDFKDWNSE
jgi:DNA-directed RNA polymerase subunit RPC12/RpoP